MNDVFYVYNNIIFYENINEKHRKIYHKIKYILLYLALI